MTWPTSYPLAVLLLGLAYTLMVYALDRHDVWGDEAVSALVLHNDVAGILAGRVDPFHPPLYFVLLRLWTGLVGGSAFGLRYLSLMGMVTAVAFVGRAARAARDNFSALLALVLAAIAPFFVYYAQEARMYGVALAFNAGALWATTAALRYSRSTLGKKFWWAWVAYAMLALGAVYAHYLSFLHLLGIAACLLLAWRRRPRMLALAAGTALVMGLVYLPWALHQMNRTRGQFPFRPEVLNLAELARVVRATLQAFSVGQTLYPDWGWIVVGLMVGLAVLGWGWALATRRPERWLHGLIVLCVLLVGWGFNAYLFAFEPRYLMMGMPAYLVLTALGLRQIAGRWPAAAAASLAIIVAAAGLSNATYYYRYSKGNYGQLMHVVSAQAQAGDLLLLNNPLQRAIFEYYRPVGPNGHAIDAVYIAPEVILEPARLDAEMTRLAGERARVWLVMFGNPQEYDPEFQVENWLATRGAKNYYAGFGDSTLSMYVMAHLANESTPVHVVFGQQIALTGYRLSASTLLPGQALIVELDWQAISAPDRDYTIFVHLLDASGQLVAQVDTPPAGGTRPTRTWTAGQQLSDRYALILPAGAPPGPASLWVGLYPWPDLNRLPVTQADRLAVADHAVQIVTVNLSLSAP